jgi:hypothetical protein
MAQQHVLDLGRGDVLGAPDDGVVDPARDEQVPLSIEAAMVAGGNQWPTTTRSPNPSAAMSSSIVTFMLVSRTRAAVWRS